MCAACVCCVALLPARGTSACRCAGQGQSEPEGLHALLRRGHGLHNEGWLSLPAHAVGAASVAHRSLFHHLVFLLRQNSDLPSATTCLVLRMQPCARIVLCYLWACTPNPASRRTCQPSRHHAPPIAPTRARDSCGPSTRDYDASSLHCAVSRPCERGRTSMRTGDCDTMAVGIGAPSDSRL